MTSTDLIQYLANVIHVVRADSHLTPKENYEQTPNSIKIVQKTS